MISEIENAMVARLRDGLGRMVSAVGSYDGALDDVGAIAHVLPACWVTFLGVQQTRPWVEEALDNGRWPAPEGENDPDRLFADYQGRLERPWPMHERTGLAYHLDDHPAVVAQDIVTTRAKDHD